MNAFFTDRMAREHADRLMADAAAIRRARRVRASRRASSRVAQFESPADRSPAAAPHRPVATAHALVRPFSAVHNWLVAGDL
jgi:hypothetical protein